MKALSFVVILFALTGCDKEYNAYLKQRAQGYTWNLRGFDVAADGTHYFCLAYDVVDSKATGGDALISGGPAVSVSATPVFRIRMFSGEEKWDRKLLREVSCSSFKVERAWLKSKNKFEYEP